MFIVSDDILERLICSQCKKYLSVQTIKVYPNRGIKCGRCSNAGDAGVVSLFGVLAEEALFRCVNRFEGCNQLLRYADVSEHEKHCIGNEYDCPWCIEPFTSTAYEMYIHFKELHSEMLLINNPEFILEIDNELVKSYLYRKNDLLFYVNAIYHRGEEELILYVTYFGTEQDSLKITQMFTLHSLDAKLKQKTKRKTCSSVTGGNTKSFRINLSPSEFPKNVVFCRFVLDTENVENLVALPEIFNKSKQVVGNKTDIIKPSAFDQGKYPVNIFNPTSKSSSVGGPWQNNFGPFYPDNPFASVSSSQANNTPVVQPTFGNISSTNTIKQHNISNARPLSGFSAKPLAFDFQNFETDKPKTVFRSHRKT